MRLRPVVLALPLLVLAATAGAQEEPAKEAEGWVKLAAPAVGRGDWETARLQLGKARKADPANVDAALLLARVDEATGDVRKALETVAALPPDVRTLTRRAELLLATGDAAGAEEAARAALRIDEDALAARRLVAAALEETGRRAAAVEQYAEVNRRWAQKPEETTEDLLAVARARLGLARVTDEYTKGNRDYANAILERFGAVVKREDAPEEAFVELGDFYLLDRGPRSHLEAKRWYTKALERNPRSAPAIFGLSQQLVFVWDDVGAQREAERALKENPQHVPSLLFLAGIALGDSAYEKAEQLVARAAAVNSERADTRGLRAALHYLRGATGSFEAEVKAVLARNKYASAPYRLLSDVLEEQRRFQEALEFAERAVQVDALDWRSYFVAGRNAMNVGDDAKAEKYLRAAERGDPFPDFYRTNFLKLYTAVAKFPHVTTKRFDVRLPPEIEDAYGPLVTQAMERHLDELQARWGFEAQAPVYVSIFDHPDDFATRTIGIPGLPALGACFGRTITLDSSRALPPGAFGWRATLHHELAHVITLQLSGGRVPRWLTEGASVYEERKSSRIWNPEMERELVDAIASDEVLTLADVNNAFRGHRVLYAYYQGGLMCDLIERDFGFPKLRELVRLFGEGLDTPDAVRRALGVEPEEFDRRFLAFAKERVAPLRVLPRPSADATAKLRTRLRKDKDDADGWALLALGQVARGDVAAALSSVGKLAELRPDAARAATVRALVAFRQNRPDQGAQFAKEAIAKGDDVYDLRLALADVAKAARRFDEAKEHLRRATELYPLATGPEAPRVVLAEMLLGEGEAQLDAAMTLLEAHVAVDEDDFVHRARLAGWHRDRGRTDEELRTLLEMRDVVPLPNAAWSREACVGLHERIAAIRLQRKEYAEAELAAGAAAAVAAMPLRPKEEMPLPDGRRSELLTVHAEALHLLGRTDDARRKVEEALRLDAANERAGALAEKLKP